MNPPLRVKAIAKIKLPIIAKPPALAAPPMDWTITLTFGEGANSNYRMQQLGTIWPRGLHMEELESIEAYFKDMGAVTELHRLADALGLDEHDNAGVLIVRRGAEQWGCDADTLYHEQRVLDHDKMMMSYKKVVNKKARYNLCFSAEAQEPNYEEGISRVVSYADVPCTSLLRDRFTELLINKTAVGIPGGPPHLQCEGNYYYKSSCGIGYHGDTQRKVVIGVRLGRSMPLCYQWYKQFQKVGDRVSLMLDHGDLFFMTDKAAGGDWKRPSIYTLRHAAGAAQYIGD